MCFSNENKTRVVVKKWAIDPYGRRTHTNQHTVERKLRMSGLVFLGFCLMTAIAFFMLTLAIATNDKALGGIGGFWACVSVTGMFTSAMTATSEFEDETFLYKYVKVN